MSPVLSDRIEVHDLHFHYGHTCALKAVSLHVPERQVTAFIGPSGCGKSTLLRCFNRMNDEIPGARVSSGSIHIGGVNIQQPSVDVVKLRREVGMVFQKSNPFPRSIFDNVAFGLQLHRISNRNTLNQAVEEALISAALWDEVKDRLHESALALSGGQQQRLCIARSLAVKPSIILMDEPCSALDPIAAAKVEDLIRTLRQKITFIIVTHNMQQAARVSDLTAFFLHGELIEFSPTFKLFSNPAHKLTEAYLRGTFG
ncbi:MAG: phosphate ABC transporter ATP-binding protein PstB [Verrucomicrobiota bacterium]